MSTITRVVGPALAEWHEDEPLRWTMSENVGKGACAERKTYSFDLTPLMRGYGRPFLLALKECWVEKRLQIALSSISLGASCIKAVLQICQEKFAQISLERGSEPPVFDRIDSDLLMGLTAIQDNVPITYLSRFRIFYKQHRYDTDLFQIGLQLNDFPTGKNGEGRSGTSSLGEFRKNILAKALSRATLVHILNITESAYEAGELSLGLFAYSRLILSRAARPESFRTLRLKDLQIDESNGTTTYYLTITIPKARTAERPLATVRLHPDVGKILDRQRSDVAERLGSLIDEKNAAQGKNILHTIGDLPLFPAFGNRMYRRTRNRLGMARSSNALTRAYLFPLVKLTGAKMNHTALRHTVGTQLAIAGCAASTIAAVLLHATNATAAVYVDLVFSDAIDELGDALEPAFLEHYPVIKEFASTNDAIDPAKRIISPSVSRSRRETTGECGRRQICQYAPIACYECPRFKPCYDADHTINLERVTEEISSARSGGLPRQTDLKRYMHIANRIRVVILICEAKRDSIAAENEAAVRSL